MSLGLRNIHSLHLPSVIALLLLLGAAASSPAQQSRRMGCPESQSKKAVKYYKEAKDLFQSRKSFDDARSLVERAIDEDPEFADAYLLQGYLAIKKRDFTTMEQSFLKVKELCPELDPEIYYQLGWLYYDQKRYPDAEKNLKQFLDFDRIDSLKAGAAESMLTRAKLLTHPVPFHPQPVAGISTPDPEYLPYISPDNELAFFTRSFEMKDKNMLVPTHVEKFIYAERKNGLFDAGQPMPPPFNASGTNNEGAATITIDNLHLFFTVNTKGNFDICASDYTRFGWEKIRNLGPNVNDSVRWDAQPSISADGNTLYFASFRNLEDSMDIYVTTKDDKGEWTKARRMGAPINTSGNEKSPFIHSDSHTLYFSSTGLPGLGGYDIFMSRMDSTGRWGKPVNLGYPINTEDDEVGFFVSTDGKTGYFSSNRFKSGGGYDIYSFELYPAARPEKILLISGQIKDEENKVPVNAEVELENTETKVITRLKADSVTGRFASVVKSGQDYLVTLKKEDYAFQSAYIAGKDTSKNEPRKVDLEVRRVALGEQYRLNDILFASNSYSINDTIRIVLDNFAQFLLENPLLKVAINGHTDNVGDPKSNLVLSDNRARTVYDYLVAQSISPARISYKGFGEALPVAPNDTEEGRAKNRRTVFVVISM